MIRFFSRLIPHTYRSHYSDTAGKKHFAVWCQWLDVIWNNEDVIVAE